MMRAGRLLSAGLKHEQIAEELAARVRNGVYAVGTFLPAERQLAEELGVSRPTLRKALTPMVESGILINHPGIGTRVVGSERSARPAAEPARSEWRILALLLPDFNNRFFVEVTEAVEYASLQRGYQLLLCNSRHQANLEETHLRQLAERRVDGVIIGHDPNLGPPETIELLERSGIPFIFLFSSPSPTRYDSILLDEHAGVQQVVRYLVSLGHREIAFCRPIPGDAPHPRETAFRRLMREHLVEIRENFFLNSERLEGPEGQQSVERLLSGRPSPSAIFAGNDRMALILLKHLAALGVRIPEDLSVVGFDNLSFTEHLTTPLTTVDQPKTELGRRAVELLIERISFPVANSDRPHRPVREVLHPHLVIRESCAARS